MKCPLIRFTCGCVGIPLHTDEPAEATPVWVFAACDGYDDHIIASIRQFDAKVGGEPLTPEEFEELRQRMVDQLSAGGAYFELLDNLDRGRAILGRFRATHKGA